MSKSSQQQHAPAAAATTRRNMSQLLLLLLLIFGLLAAVSGFAVAADVRVAPQLRYDRLPAAVATEISSWQSESLITDAGGGGGVAANICSHCYCHRNMVYCDYARNRTLPRVLNGATFVPSNVTSMELQLSGHTQLELHGGFFQNKRVNSFIVRGAAAGQGHSDQVELARDAFRGNQGGYPDIQIRQVPTVFVRSQAFSAGEIKFRVEHADQLRLFAGAFTNMNMSCSFSHIGELQMEKKAFNPSTDRSATAQVRLRIEHARIEEIHSFEVSMHEIRFINCSIGAIRRNAFDVTNIDALLFENSHIDTIEAQAFTSKLHSDHVSITGATIRNIDSEAIMGSGISMLTLKHNTIETIKPQAITVYSVDVYITHNVIEHLGHHWLQVKNGDLIAIDHNRFGHFAAMQLEELSKQSNCSFASNWVAHPQPHSLNFTKCEVHKISVQRTCGCNTAWLDDLTSHDLSSELYCRLDPRLTPCFNDSAVHVRRYVNEACGENRTTLRCLDGSQMSLHMGVFYTSKDLARQKQGTSIGWPIFVGIGVGSIVVLVALALLLVGYCRRGQPSSAASSSGSGDSCCNFSPSHIEILRVELTKLGGGHKPLKKSLERLIMENRKKSSEQCRKAITHIVSDMSELPPRINKVLSDHLAEHSLHKEPVYAEQSGSTDGIVIGQGHGLPLDGGDYYTTALGLPSAPSAPSVQEHIYAELQNSPQQPLLPNEYASPADPHDPHEAPEYMEPFNARDPHDMPPAYEAMSQQQPQLQPLPQYATPMRQPQLPQLPSSSAQPGRQLPDVLQRSRNEVSYATPILRGAAGATATETQAQRHVRDLRQDLEAMPQFHPNQLSSARNQRQLQASFPRRPQYNNNSNTNNNNKRDALSGSSSFDCSDGAASLAAMEHMDMRGAAALPPDSGSDHSGGSDETVKIDDVIEYADA